MRFSMYDWRLLDRRDQLVVGVYVDRGERVENPRLRPIAAAMASGLLRDQGGSALADAQRIAAAMGYDSTYVERLLADAGPDVR